MNICSGQETDLLALIHTLGEVMDNKPDPIFSAPRPGDIYRSIGDPGQAARVINFKASVSLFEGLANTVAWMRS